MSPLAASPPELPQRTWHGWSLDWPKWFRIGFWAGLGVVMLHVALAVRIYVGLHESPQLKELRQLGASIWLYSDNFGNRHINYLMSGLYGRSCANVREIHIYHSRDREVLRHVKDHFPNLVALVCVGEEVEAADLELLSRCESLTHINLRYTNLDDQGAAWLAKLPRLQWLDAEGTLLGDDGYRALIQNPSLKRLRIVNSNVSLPVIQQSLIWPGLVIERNRNDTYHGLFTSLRWSDGSRSVRFPAAQYCRIERLASDTGLPEHTEKRYTFDDARHFWHPTRQTHAPVPDGKYRFRWTIGELRSDPVELSVTNGICSIHAIDFQLPCTKAEAL